MANPHPPLRFGARGRMPEGFRLGMRVRLSLQGHRHGICRRHPRREGEVRGASSDGTCVYVRWDGNGRRTVTVYHKAFLEAVPARPQDAR